MLGVWVGHAEGLLERSRKVVSASRGLEIYLSLCSIRPVSISVETNTARSMLYINLPEYFLKPTRSKVGGDYVNNVAYSFEYSSCLKVFNGTELDLPE
jgi:hypothetical protein